MKATVQSTTVLANWHKTRLRFVVSLNPSRSEVSDLPPDTRVSFLPMEAVGDDGTLDLKQTRRLAEVATGYTYFAENDIVIAKVTPCFENGKGALARGLQNKIAFGTTELIAVRAQLGKAHGKFVYWLFRSDDFRSQACASMSGASGLKRVSDDFVRNYRTIIPDIEHQVLIADFLDCETKKIDEMISEQERFIGLLDEKRQSVILNAVSKGFDSGAPMKESGVEFLGKIPKEWVATKLKYIAPRITVGVVVMPSQYYADNGVPALRSLNVGNMTLILNNLVYFSPQSNNLLAKSKLQTDDLVAVRTGVPGATAVITPDLDGANCIDLILIRKSDRFLSRFVAFAMNSRICQEQIKLHSDGAIQQHLNIETARNLNLALPPLDAQEAIVAFLDVEINKLNILALEVEKTISLLKERRAALISAAVTGKIDVRAAVTKVRDAA